MHPFFRQARTSLSLRKLVFLFSLQLFLFIPTFGQDGTLKWSFETGLISESAPAIGDEGIIYIGSWDNNLYALQPDGTEKWRFDAGGNVDQPPVIAPDGTIYISPEDSTGRVLALNVDGSVKWTFESGVDENLSGEMALAVDGTLYVGLGSSVFAINPNGSQLWSFEAATGTRGIVVGNDGVVLVNDGNGRIYARNPADGTEIWQARPVNVGVNAPVSLAEDGTIYHASRQFFALDPEDGSTLWSVDPGDAGEAPATAVDGTIYLPIAESATEGGLVALDPSDGSEKWRFEVGTRVQSTPAVGFDGIIYFGTDSEELYALTPNGGLLWSFKADGDLRSSPTIAEDGTIIFGSRGGTVYAINGSSSGLAASSWPKKHRDVRNTGQFGSDVTRRRFFAPHFFWLDEVNKSIITLSHTGGSAGTPLGPEAEFRIDVINRDGTVRFSHDEMLSPGQTTSIELEPGDGQLYAGSVVIDAPVKDGSFLAPHLTWQLDVSPVLDPLNIGVFFSAPEDAALVHHFPGEANEDVGLGIGVQNIGFNQIECDLEFYSNDGTQQAVEVLDLAPLGSIVEFFNDSVPEGFQGKAALLCDAPVVAISVNQDFANGGFPTDRVTIKRRN